MAIAKEGSSWPPQRIRLEEERGITGQVERSLRGTIAGQVERSLKGTIGQVKVDPRPWLGPYGIEALTMWNAKQPGPARKVDPMDSEECIRLACGPLGMTVTVAYNTTLTEFEYLASMWIERQHFESESRRESVKPKKKPSRKRPRLPDGTEPTFEKELDAELQKRTDLYFYRTTNPSVKGLAKYFGKGRRAFYPGDGGSPRYIRCRERLESLMAESKVARGRTPS